MTGFKATLQVEANGEQGLKEVPVDAASLRTDGDWIIFSSDRVGGLKNAVAAFPTDRIVSVVKDV